VDEHYAALRTFTGDGTGPAPIDAVLKLLGDLQQQLAQVATATPGGAPVIGGGADPAGLLRAEASRDPAPVSHWLDQLSGGANAIRGGGAREQAAAALNGPGGPGSLCHKAVDNRYPFFPGSSNDIPLEDFARLFAPGGLLDAYFNTQLRPFVDTSGATWKAKAVQGVAPPVSAAALAQFQRAAAIRDSFFAAGATQPSVRFEITPVSLDAATRQVTLELGDRSVAYAHGPPRPTEITWPGPNGMNTARLVFDPAPPDATGVVQASGPWAPFRLFDAGHLTREGSADRYRLTFSAGGREAVFDIRAASVLTPLSPAMLRAFRCPGL
jgi:type VI secretion system protein ImpL